MDRQLLTLVAFFVVLIQGATSTVLIFKNNCKYPVWPGILNVFGQPFNRTGFELTSRNSTVLDAPENWTGQVWARTMCSTDSSGKFSCLSADCGTGKVACNAAGATPPVTLVNIALRSNGEDDFYSTSLIDGFNVPVSLVPVAETGHCRNSACPVDINARCPTELRAVGPGGRMVGCKSGCVAFGSDRECCKGEYSDPEKCKPTNYSKWFKSQCSQSYTYPNDDPNSTFSCYGPKAYAVTFCP